MSNQPSGMPHAGSRAKSAIFLKFSPPRYGIPLQVSMWESPPFYIIFWGLGRIGVYKMGGVTFDSARKFL